MTAKGYRPFSVDARDRIVGFFVIGAILLFLLGFLIPAIQKLNSDQGLGFYTTLDQTYGIAVDASVSMRGVMIGKVTGVHITDQGLVRVNMSLSPEYEHFYTADSHFSVDTNIGVNTILTGSGLVLHPADKQNARLKVGAYIPTETPQGLQSVLQKLDVARLADQVTGIVRNVDDITAGMNRNQDKIYRSIDNLETVTASLAQVSKTLPGMVESVNRSLASLQGNLEQVNKLVANADNNLQKTLGNTVALTDQATKTLTEAQLLFHETTPVMRQLPGVLVTTNVALQSLTRLSDQMSHSWLLGGRKAESQPAVSGPGIHPHDDSLYQLPAGN